MSEGLALNLLQSAFRTTLLLVGPLLLITVIAGLFVSILQAITSIQEQSLSFVIKLMTLIISFVILFPFLMHVITNYTSYIITNIPQFIK
jgi:flagellar biosynthetic protein FliQ